jgi:hypothetical protein
MEGKHRPPERPVDRGTNPPFGLEEALWLVVRPSNGPPGDQARAGKRSASSVSFAT